MSEWISVKERLPKEGVDVLALNTFNGLDRSFCVVVYYEDNADDWCWFQDERQGSEGRWGRTAFGYWQPLPEPPAESEREA